VIDQVGDDSQLLRELVEYYDAWWKSNARMWQQHVEKWKNTGMPTIPVAADAVYGVETMDPTGSTDRLALGSSSPRGRKSASTSTEQLGCTVERAIWFRLLK
jgi:hypothetical protein